MDRYKLEIVNNHGDRYIRCDPAPDGSWVMFRDVAALQKRCEEAERERDALATARREGMKDAAKWHEAKALEASAKAASARNFQQLLRQSDFHMESAAAIRAATKEGKP